MQRTKKEIYALIQRGERLHAECKEAFGGMPDTLWESYSSFANTDGGVILLGIKERVDHSLVVQGVRDADALIKSFWDTANNAEKVSLNVVDRRGVYAVDCDGKLVVVVEVGQKVGQNVGQNVVSILKSRQEVDNKETRSRQEELSELSSSARRVFSELAKDPYFTQAGLVSKLGLSRAAITIATATLIKRGLLRRIGPKKGGHWEIVEHLKGEMRK